MSLPIFIEMLLASQPEILKAHFVERFALYIKQRENRAWAAALKGRIYDFPVSDAFVDISKWRNSKEYGEEVFSNHSPTSGDLKERSNE